jgi:uroporphyrinogen-III synthase
VSPRLHGERISALIGLDVTRTWVLTRAQPDADADVAALRAEGITAQAVPCIERVALKWPNWQPITAHRVILVSSPFAGVQLVHAWPSLPLPRPKVAAMAPITSAKLQEQGIPIEIRAEGGVVALANALKTWSQQHPGPLAILYATSDIGIRQLEQDEALALMRSFATVDRIPVYSTRAPLGLDATLGGLEPGLGYVFMSPSAVENALASFARRGQTLFAGAVACIGQSTHRRFRELAVHPAPTHHSSFGAFVKALLREKPR